MQDEVKPDDHNLSKENKETPLLRFKFSLLENWNMWGKLGILNTIKRWSDGQRLGCYILFYYLV